MNRSSSGNSDTAVSFEKRKEGRNNLGAAIVRSTSTILHYHIIVMCVCVVVLMMMIKKMYHIPAMRLVNHRLGVGKANYVVVW